MAVKKAKKVDNGVGAQAKVVKEVAFGLGEDLVGLALKNAKTSQDILEKVIKGGVTIFGMQQRLTLDTIEKVVTSDQFRKMTLLPKGYFNRFMNVAETSVKEVKETMSEVKETVAEVTEAISETADSITDKVQDAFTGEKDDLTKIKGIGPKAAGILSEAGYNTFASLTNASIADLKAVLTKAGNRYAKLDPSTWIEQAVFAATADWTALKNWNKAK